MLVKCEQPLDELTVQVWLPYYHPNFKYCTLFISGTELRTDGRTDDPNTRCPRRTFQAGGIKIPRLLVEECLYNRLKCFKSFNEFLGHRSQRLQWPIVITRCPSSVCRLSSVVRRPSSVRLFTFSTSSPEPLDGFWWNLVWMKYSRSLTSVVVFRPEPSRGGSRAGQK